MEEALSVAPSAELRGIQITAVHSEEAGWRRRRTPSGPIEEVEAIGLADLRDWKPIGGMPGSASGDGRRR